MQPCWSEESTDISTEQTHLDGVVRVQKHVFSTDAAVDAAHAHEQTETEEVTVVWNDQHSYSARLDELS